MTIFDDQLAAQMRALDAAIPQPTLPVIPAAASRVRRFPVRRLALLAAVLAIVGGATTSLLMLHGSFGGDAYQYAWTHATMLGMTKTDQGYTVTLEAAYADAAQMMLAVSVVDAQNRGWSQLDASSADVQFADGSGPSWAMTEGGSAPASMGAANTVWLAASAPSAPGVHSVTVTVPAVRYRDPEPVGAGDPWHEVLGSWVFTFDLPIAGGRRVDLDTATTVHGVTATAVSLFSTPTVVEIDVRWSDRGPTATTSGWSSLGTAFHDGHEIPMGGGVTAADGETLTLLAGTEDPSGHWKIVIDEVIGDESGGGLVRLAGPWVLEFDVPPG
jgi:hypothetical protein